MTRSLEMEGKKVAPATATTTAPNAAAVKEKPDRRSGQGSGSGGGGGGGSGGGGMDLSEENVDAFYKKMLVRAPNKRQVIGRIHFPRFP